MTTQHQTGQLSLLAVGQLFLDLVYAGLPSAPVPGKELWTAAFASGPGGIANQGVAAARLGASAAIAAFVGDDPISALCLDALTAEGVDTAACRTVPGWRLPVTASIASGDDRAMVTGGVAAPATGLFPAGPPAAHVAVADLGADSADWISTAASAGTAVYATIGWDEHDRWDTTALSQLDHCAAFQPNATEAVRYTGRATPAAAATALAERVPLAVVTLGGDGVLAVDATDGVVVQRPPVRVSAVDATGAGDVFGAALAVSHHTAWTLAERLDFASLVAAITATAVGGATTAPTLASLLPWLDTHPDAAEPGRFRFLRDALAVGAASPFAPAGPPAGHTENRPSTAVTTRSTP